MEQELSVTGGARVVQELGRHDAVGVHVGHGQHGGDGTYTGKGFHQGSFLKSVRVPVTAAAAAMAGLSRCVRT